MANSATFFVSAQPGYFLQYESGFGEIERYPIVAWKLDECRAAAEPISLRVSNEAPSSTRRVELIPAGSRCSFDDYKTSILCPGGQVIDENNVVWPSFQDWMDARASGR